MGFNRLLPYNDLPLLPPKTDIETIQILKMAIRANKALAELRMSGHLIPNQVVLIQALGLSEAKLSSEIENIVTTNDELFKAFSDIHADMDFQTKEVLFYAEALWYGYHAIKQKKRLLSAVLFEELVRILKSNDQGIRKLPGTHLKNSLGEIMYTPPEGEEVIRNLLSNLESFIYKETSIDPLIQLAVIHYQFEAIHPFADGNGRAGRILNILFLIEKGLLDIPVLYLSRYILSNKNLYYHGLRDVTEKGAWESWICYILEGIEQTAIITRQRIVAIHQLMQKTAERVRSQLPRVYSKDLMELLFKHPYCKIKFLEEANIGHRQTSSQYLKQLEKIGVLYRLKAGRENYYINKAFLEILKEP